MPSYDSRDFWIRDRAGMNQVESQRVHRERPVEYTVQGQTVTAQYNSYQEEWRRQWQQLQRQGQTSPQHHYTWNSYTQDEESFNFIKEDEWEYLKHQLYEGCTVTWLDDRQKLFGTITADGRIRWQGSPDTSVTLALCVYSQVRSLGDIKHPDGRPFAVEKNPKALVLFKIKSLERRFKARTLPKTKLKALPLP